ncbi:MAG: LuxR C-terminal-related transcriptional regulator, partial [Candidatus Dormibacteraeota bacterium]|nr:LuxR C-terminal-related transcriptional regulator [Candidatus Dormibacteraeota bacterium]
ALDDAGRRAGERAAHASAAVAFEEAARLGQPGEARAGRHLAAAENAWLAGHVDRAIQLLDAARRLDPGPNLRLEIDNLAGHIAMRQGAVREGFWMQVATAHAVQRRDRLKAARILADAVVASYGAGYPEEMLPAAAQALQLLRPGDPPDVTICVHVAYGALAILAGRGSDGPRHMHVSVDLFRSVPVADWNPLVFVCACIAGTFLREAESGRELLNQALSGAREHAPAAALPPVLLLIGRDAATTERWAEARGYYDEGTRLARDTTQFTWLAGALAGLAWLDALEGRSDECRAHAAEGSALSERYGMGFFSAWTMTALAELELGLGRPEAAIGHLLACQRLLADSQILDPDLAPAPLLVDAYLRVGRVAEARAAASDHEALAVAKGQPFSLARAARVRGLLADDGHYAAEFESALGHHADAPDTFERARTQLCYGERLRRGRQRVEARGQLRAALAAFDRLGARPWAARALAELAASGEKARVRDDSSRHLLTPQELQVALALAEGRTTRGAAAKLYLSPKTVEYHLRNVYDKLEIRSREELAAALRPPD